MVEIQKLVQKGTRLREKARHQQALEVLDEALRLSLAARDYRGAADALGARALAWKHLFQLTGDRAYLEFYKADAMTRLSVVKTKKVPALHSAHFRAADHALLTADYKTAATHFRLALKNYCGSWAEKGDYRYHYGEALYRLGGRQTGLRELKDGLRDIQKYRAEVNSFLANIWESGANMVLAELLWKTHGAQAKKYLAEAAKIIAGDKRLIMRKKQLKILERKLKG